MKKLLVIDDHPAVMEGTKAILETGHSYTVDCLNPDSSDDEFVKKHDFSVYDVILMDLNLGDINGIDLTKKILEAYPSIKIVVYTGYEVDDYFDEAIKAGMYGAISKAESKEKIIKYISHVIDNEILVPYPYLKQLITHKKTKTHNINEHELLTERECLILQEVERGLTNQEIADVLHLSKRSIEYSLTSIFNKLNVGSRTEAVLIAKSEGVLDS